MTKNYHLIFLTLLLSSLRTQVDGTDDALATFLASLTNFVAPDVAGGFDHSDDTLYPEQEAFLESLVGQYGTDPFTDANPLTSIQGYYYNKLVAQYLPTSDEDRRAYTTYSDARGILRNDQN